MKLSFCAACGSTNDLQHHNLIARGEAGSDDEHDLITLCGSCHTRLDERQANSAPALQPQLNVLAPSPRVCVRRWSHSRVCRPLPRPKSWRAGASPRPVAVAGQRAR
jgi:hypothetical protein